MLAYFASVCLNNPQAKHIATGRGLQMDAQQAYSGSVGQRIAQLFAEGGSEADKATTDYYTNFANNVGPDFTLATESAKRFGFKPCDFINYADALTHVGVFERRITPTQNRNGIPNGCTFEFRRLAKATGETA